MNPVKVLREFDRLGVRIDVRSGRVHYDAPKGVMTPERVERLRSVKDHLIELLDGPPTHRRAIPAERCHRCRELEAQGVRVLACSECDVEYEAEQ